MKEMLRIVISLHTFTRPCLAVFTAFLLVPRNSSSASFVRIRGNFSGGIDDLLSKFVAQSFFSFFIGLDKLKLSRA
jgi:zinc transporter ZupT